MINNMSAIVQNLKVLMIKYPVVRGMVSYSCIWPTSSLIQQTIEGKTWGKFLMFLLHWIVMRSRKRFFYYSFQIITIGGVYCVLVYMVDFLLLPHYIVGLRYLQRCGHKQHWALLLQKLLWRLFLTRRQRWHAFILLWVYWNWKQ